MISHASAVLRGVLITIGILSAVMLVLAFTSLPFRSWYALGTKAAGINRLPGYIVLLGGGGMPSESGLMRTWYAAGIAKRFPDAKIIIALPGDTSDATSALNLMKSELVMRGVSKGHILLEDSGTNTRSQALNIYKRIVNIEQRKLNIEQKDQSSFVNRNSSILIVTSPEHLYRAVGTFKRAGFKKVDGVPAFEQAIASDIGFRAGRLGGRNFIPDIGENITLRYQFWTQMNYELLVIREFFAITYYKLNGWI